MTPDAFIDNYDWKNAWLVSGEPSAIPGFSGEASFGLSDIDHVIASDEGENDGRNWIAVLNIGPHPERFAFLSAGCDYTGWDCQAGGHIKVAGSLADLCRLGMDDDDLERLGLARDGSPVCVGCGQPMLPPGVEKKPNEYDHASGCPREEKRP